MSANHIETIARAKLNAPADWYRPKTTKAVGFAGGLGPETLAPQLPMIADVATGRWWLDMEGRLRTAEDLFDIGRAQRAVTAFRQARAVA